MTEDDAFVKNASNIRVKLDKLSEDAPNGPVLKRVERAYDNIEVALEQYRTVHGEPDDE